MRVEEIIRYPLKSGAGESLDSASISLRGLPYDRHWMVVTGSGTLVSQRDRGMQKLSLVTVSFDGDSVQLSAPNHEALSLPVVSSTGERLEVQVHSHRHPAIDEGKEAALWITSYLGELKGEPLRLVHFPSDYVRSLKDLYTQSDNAVTEFADGYPILVTSIESLEKLNEELVQAGEDRMPMNRFRANIVISGGEPFFEDGLRQIRIGGNEGAVLEFVKPCSRCPIPSVIQESGEFIANRKEPNRTLSRIHRGEHLMAQFPHLEQKYANQPMFGQNAIVLQQGIVSRGDDVEVESRR